MIIKIYKLKLNLIVIYSIVTYSKLNFIVLYSIYIILYIHQIKKYKKNTQYIKNRSKRNSATAANRTCQYDPVRLILSLF